MERHPPGMTFRGGWGTLTVTLLEQPMSKFTRDTVRCLSNCNFPQASRRYLYVCDWFAESFLVHTFCRLDLAGNVLVVGLCRVKGFGFGLDALGA
jgi:hypothetical protein